VVREHAFYDFRVFFKGLFLRQRERESERGREKEQGRERRGRGRERIPSRLPLSTEPDSGLDLTTPRS